MELLTWITNSLVEGEKGMEFVWEPQMEYK